MRKIVYKIWQVNLLFWNLAKKYNGVRNKRYNSGFLFGISCFNIVPARKQFRTQEKIELQFFNGLCFTLDIKNEAAFLATMNN